MTTVIVVDDDEKLLRMLKRTLLYEGFHVSTASNGEEALKIITPKKPDVVVLDWLMPKLNGVEVIQALRQANNNIPILMLTAKDAVEDRVEGLESGADDYLVKPFAPQELIARIRALLRRTQTDKGDTPLTFEDLHLDPVTRETKRGDRVFRLTPTEFDLLHYFLRHPQHVLPRQRILDAVWGYDFGENDNVLEVYIGYLRKKMESDDEPRLIQTVYSVGYVLRGD